MCKKILLPFLLWAVVSCQDDMEAVVSVCDDDEEEASYYSGVMNIKVSEELAAKFAISSDSSKVSTRVESVDNVISALGVTSMRRMFACDPRFEKRTRAEGLHLWYTIEFCDTVPITRATSSMGEIEGVEIVEKCPQIVSYGESFRFNDPYFSNQWHYYNDGSYTSECVAGADVNLLNGWMRSTGRSDVIVAVVDGGIDYTHEDLKDNMWVNTAELNGTSNKDDDENGYKDDVYGYNFVESKGSVVAHTHGTHVAGTIGAVNNNGVGCCGVAGGDGSGNGVRLMSCQIFLTVGGKDISGNDAAAIKYAADNGAVICQCSWGYDELSYTPSSTKSAIDYFVKYAGCDDDGNQVGPMKGGVVIFAAGNDHVTKSYPASEESVIAVAAIDWDYKASDYTNYGDWVDICAPGTKVYSTLPGNKYGTKTGTSMSCPHVSGAAALIVSKFGREGFTNTQLTERLLNTTSDRVYEYNPSYIGQLGRGLLDIEAALHTESTNPPYPIEAIWSDVSANTVELCWTIPDDPDEYDAVEYFYIYYSTAPITDTTNNSVSRIRVTNTKSVGENVSYSFALPEFNKQYYIVIASSDLSGNHSDVSNCHVVNTLSNNAPIITVLDSCDIRIKSHECANMRLKVIEPDKHSFCCSYSDSDAGTYTVVDSIVTISVNALKAEPGSYTSVLTVTDKYGLSSSQKINYTILPNHAPYVKTAPENVYMSSLDYVYTFNPSNYIYDEDGEELSFSASSSTTNFYLKGSLSTFYLYTTTYGLGTITLTATDARGETCETEFLAISRDDSEEIDLYPNPVSNYLNIRVGKTIDEVASIDIYNSIGVKSFSTMIQISTFAPGKIDLSSLPGGNYSIFVRIGNKTINRNIIKL